MKKIKIKLRNKFKKIVFEVNTKKSIKEYADSILEQIKQKSFIVIGNLVVHSNEIHYLIFE